ncbi:hypothetical protein JCM5296_005435 [Sporobolomyces johnsonii]
MSESTPLLQPDADDMLASYLAPAASLVPTPNKHPLSPPPYPGSLKHLLRRCEEPPNRTKARDAALYDDEFVTVTKGGILRIKHLHCWGSGHRIEIDNIRDLWSGKGREGVRQKKPLRWWEIKVWGLGKLNRPTGILFAWAGSRFKTCFNAAPERLEKIVVMSMKKGWCCRVGFTINDPRSFFGAVNKVRAAQGLGSFVF